MTGSSSPDPKSEATPPDLLTPLPGALNLRPQTSAILEQLADDAAARETLKIADLVAVLQTRAFGALCLIAALLAVMPVVNIVGATVLLIVGAQLAIGLTAPKLPRFLREREIPGPLFGRSLDRVLPTLKWIERFFHPRWPLLTAGPARVVTGILLMLLGIVLFVPIPFSQLLPGFTAVVLALCLLQRDGLMLLAGLALSAASLIVGYFMMAVTVRGVIGLWNAWF